jgi:hypothetical protein
VDAPAAHLTVAAACGGAGCPSSQRTTTTTTAAPTTTTTTTTALAPVRPFLSAFVTLLLEGLRFFEGPS